MKTAQKIGISVLFGSLVAVWHTFFFNVRVNSRMVFQPWLLQQGFIPYAHIGDEHTPLLPLLLSWLLPIFDNDALITARAMHGLLIGLIVVICIWAVFNQTGLWGAIACGAYFFALSRLGFWAMWYDLAIVPIFLAAFFVITSNRFSFTVQLLLIGLLSGVGFLVKQQAILLFVIVPIALVTQPAEFKNIRNRYIKPLILSILGVLIPILVYLLYYFSLTNDWYAIWYWVILFNLVGEYSNLGAKTPSMKEIQSVLPVFIMVVPFLLKTIGLTYTKKNSNIAGLAKRWWLLLIMALAAIMLYPRYSTMHWATMLPFLAMASGIACAELLPATRENKAYRYQQWGIYLAVVGMLWIGSGILSYGVAYQNREMRTLIEYDSLPELAKLITDTTSLENIALFPDDEGVGNLYYLLQKTPPRFWLMNYPWFRNEYEINQWFKEMEIAQPEQIIYFTSRNPQLYPEMNDHILGKYTTVHIIQWNDQIVEIKERNSLSPEDVP